ncbi:MAG: serpin family protein [Clostridiaceae bacterium]
MKRLKLIPLFLAAMLLISCAPANPVTPDGKKPNALLNAPGKVLSAPEYPKPRSFNDFGGREEIDESYLEAARSFCAKSAVLALNDTEGKNALVSPMSLFFALAMAAEGARGNTKAQLLSALGADETLLKSETAKLFRQLYFENEYGSFKTYNSAWLDGRAQFDQSTLNALSEAYYAECIAADFTGTAYKKQIADWISDRTNGLLGGDPESFELDPQTLMALINTLYYKDQWISRFSEENTAAADFYNAGGNTVQADFLNGTRSGGFSVTDQFTAASIQLKNGSIRFVLPNEGIAPEDILRDKTLFEPILNGTQEENGFGEITWSIPKFDYAVELDLGDTLKGLGVSDAFSSEIADFSGFTTSEQLFLSSVRQGSKIAVNEDGIEAASYTELAFAGSSMPLDSAEMILNRPFLYIVYVSGMPVFVGVVNEMNG